MREAEEKAAALIGIGTGPAYREERLRRAEARRVAAAERWKAILAACPEPAVPEPDEENG